MNPSFDPAILEIDGDTAALIAASCPACGAVTFPRRPRCARCDAPTRDCRLPDIGIVRSFCRLAIPLPGAEPPVTLVRVELGPATVIQGVLAGTVQIGDRVALVTRPLPDGKDGCTGFGFARCAS